MEIEQIELFTEFDRVGGDKIMSDKEWQYLEDHVREHGVLHPLGLEWSTADGFAYLGEGHHRLEVAKRLGLKTVPVMVIRNSRPLEGRSRGSRHVGTYCGAERDAWDAPRAPDIFTPRDISLPVVEARPQIGSLDAQAPAVNTDVQTGVDRDH